MPSGKSLKLPTLYRDVEVQRASLNKDKRTIRVQFATETPVGRWFGKEILDCSKASVDMSRVNAGAAVLVEHSSQQRCGITESGHVTGERTCEAEIRLARNPLGDSILAEVEDGTLRFVSVGYRVEKFEVNEDEDEYRAIRWQPLEISFVGIPADPSAKILRNNEPEHEPELMMTRSKQLDHSAGGVGPAGGGGAPAIHTTPDVSRNCNEAEEMWATCAQYVRTHPQVLEFTRKAAKDKTPLIRYLQDVMGIVSTPNEPVSGYDQRAAGAASSGRRSIGARWTEDEAFKAAVDQKDLRNLAVEIKDECRFGDLRQMMSRAALNATTEGLAGTSGVNIDEKQEINLLGQQELMVSDLFAQATTDGDVVRFTQESTFTNAATAVTEGSAKPEATLDLGVQNATVRKCAVWTDVTEEMMMDFKQASAFINGRLSYMVQAREDQHLLTGSNASNQVVGILNTSGIQTTSGAVNTIDKLLTAKSLVEGTAGAGFGVPTAYIIHPNNWLGVRLTKDANGQYLLGGPGYAPYGVGGFVNVGMLWGLPVVSTVSMTQGTALVGAFKSAATIYRRMGLTIKTTNSDGTKFQSNILTILAEQRFALTVEVANKFCSVTAIPATAL